MQLFRDVMSYGELHDLGFFGPQFTWKGPGMRSMLDKGIATPSWMDVFQAAELTSDSWRSRSNSSWSLQDSGEESGEMSKEVPVRSFLGSQQE